MFRAAIFWISAIAGIGPLCAQTASELEFFEKQVRPLFATHCYGCHSSQAKVVFAELRLDQEASVRKTGERIVKALRGESLQRMPPAGKLKDEEIAVVEQWMRMGAPFPKTVAAVRTGTGFDLQQRRKEHWAWHPVKTYAPPNVLDTAWPLQATDRFILAKLEAQGLRPAAPADRNAWLRRVTLDLTGLPPAPEEIAAFLHDVRPGANERVVDRLLESPHYGERMARRWMDIIRYSESHGSEGDPDTPQAWQYRDYLVRAFNADVPYDQLIREHIAGDQLPVRRLNAKDKLDESRIGAAHWRMVEHGFQPVDPWEDRVKWTDNQVDVFSKAFQGLTISCARCHDHKFDAISQRDFYALFGILAGARPTQVAIDTDDVLLQNREALRELRPRLKEQLARLWRDDVRQAQPVWKEGIGKESALYPLKDGVDVSKWAAEMRAELASRREFNAKNFQTAWMLTGDDYDKWVRQGVGAPAKPSQAGEISIEPGGGKLISAIYPAGVYSNLLTRKHGAVIQSPRFKVETDSISLRMLGGNFGFAQLIIENYAVPRGGIYKLRASAKKDQMGWVHWDATFWKGFTAYIEFSTMAETTHFALDDQDNRTKVKPVASKDGRSWFGVQQVVFHNNQLKPKEESIAAGLLLDDVGSREAYVSRLRQVAADAIAAWSAGSLSDAQAALLDDLMRHGWLTNAVERVPMAAEYRQLEEEIAVPRRAPGVLDEHAPDQQLLVRGDHRKPGDRVPRQYLTALDSKPYSDPGTTRLQLAGEIASAANPLTARVMVNRLWQIAFRRGIVRTVDNFGKLGETPTHPELLDYLAGEFVKQGWSVKKMLRTLMTSRAYQMGSIAEPKSIETDASNNLFHHVPLRRMEAEEIRDAILSASGQLDKTMYGRSVNVFYAHDTGATKGDRPKGPLDGNGRRSVYLEIRRNATHPFLEVFDVYKPTSTRGQRDVTTVPAQSLALMNSPFVVEQAAKWAASMAADQQPVESMYMRTFGRKPTAVERDEAQTYLSATDLASLAQALWNLKEFLYVR